MKQTFLTLLATLLATTATAQAFLPSHMDTLTGRNPRYHYTDWYDTCHSYDSGSLSLHTAGTSHYYFYSDSNKSVVLREHLTDSPLRIAGVAAMVHIIDSTPDIPSMSMPRAYESLLLFQGTDEPDVPRSWLRDFPRKMTLLDSMRWDTASPYILKVPRNRAAENSLIDTDFTYCLVYEVYFDSAITVDSIFYIAGTGRSNISATIYNDDGTINVRCRYFPTEYMHVVDNEQYVCDKCRPCGRSFGGRYPHDPLAPPDSVWRRINYYTICVGPFLPILADD